MTQPNEMQRNLADTPSPEIENGMAGEELPYEKPRLGSIRLFADEVLGGCRLTPGLCTTIAPVSAGS